LIPEAPLVEIGAFRSRTTIRVMPFGKSLGAGRPVDWLPSQVAVNDTTEHLSGPARAGPLVPANSASPSAIAVGLNGGDSAGSMIRRAPSKSWRNLTQAGSLAERSRHD
jgi:hypothetical protein